MLYFNNQGDLTVDVSGVCIERNCRYCNYRGAGGLRTCDVDDGVKEPRVCVYPGRLVHPHDGKLNEI